MVALLIYIVGVFAIGAFAAYPISVLLEVFGVTGTEFHSVLTRTLKLLAIFGLFPVLMYLRANDRRCWGFGVTRFRFLRHVLLGLVIGILSLGFVAATLLLQGVRINNEAATFSAVQVIWLVVRVSLVGLVIGFVEEVWFRGALYSAAQRAFGVLGAISLTAALYATVHFLKGDASMDPSQPDWFSGVSVLAATFAELASADNIDSALALFVGGLALGLARYSGGSIAVCIGIHAGWVIVIKLAKAGTRLDHHSDWAWMSGSYDGFIGYLGAAWLLLLVIAYYWCYVRHRENTGRH
jgi:membrane protease YdiL (CAAX protease family)